MKSNEINIRDPFVVYANDTYYLYGTRAKNFGQHVGGMDVYVSNDLEDWSEPIECFNSEIYGLNRKVNWAPEVHKYLDKYYMFATFTRENGRKGTYSLVSDTPLGPFVPNSISALTPEEWECLDGTLYVEDGVPYMIFCHEWIQIRDGEICSVRLSEDLCTAVGEPKVLFKASDMPCATGTLHNNGYITDGPFIYKNAADQLIMIWSSFDDKGYIEAVSLSENGKINGKWNHCVKPLSSENGGHGMLFKDRYGELYFTMHSPNRSGTERVRLFKMREIEKQPFFEFV